MQIDAEGNMELTAEENQALMDQLNIPPSEYDDPPVSIEWLKEDEQVIVFKASNIKTGKFVHLEFDRLGSQESEA